MEWVERLNLVIGYIEVHLEDVIDTKEIEKLAACPAESFYRMFSRIAGVTIPEYIRRRKMTKAAFELLSAGEKVVDIAMKYGYDSADAFSVAFKRVHGISPAAARQQNVKLTSFPRLSFTLIIKGVVEMNYRVIEKEEFRVIGRIGSMDDDIWGQVKKDGFLDRCVEVARDPCTLGLCFGYDENGANKYMVAVESDTQGDPGMDELTLPKSTWLVFESKGPIQPTLGQTWERIYNEFLPQSVYNQTDIPTMEKYFSGDVMSDDYYVEIWIPVVKK